MRMARKGSYHVVFGFMTFALLAVMAFVGLYLTAPAVAAQILEAISALTQAIKG